jgi:hypothetical protein
MKRFSYLRSKCLACGGRKETSADIKMKLNGKFDGFSTVKTSLKSPKIAKTVVGFF